MTTRGSERLALLRALAILKRLLEGPATNEQLIEAVLQSVGAEAYPPAAGARQAAFKRDRQRLRRELGVRWEFVNQEYVLKDAGPYFSLALPEEALRALAILTVTFSGQSGEHGGVDALLRFLLDRLPEEQRRRLEGMDAGVSFEIFQQVDPNGIPQRVWETVQRAVRSRRELSFRYRSPRYRGEQAFLFRVAPLRIVYQWGHWYLFAYVLRRDPPLQFQGEDYRRFRLFYIQDDDDLRVLPSMVSVLHRRPPRYEVHYRLLPPLGRGVVSRHFDEMEVTTLEDGSVEVRGVTDDLFEAERILLGYGQYCVALGGPELKRRIQEAVRGMTKNLASDE